MSENGKKSKRGRKPKIKVSEPPMIKKEINSDEEPLISHLNISLKDILDNNSENSSPLEEDSIMTASESDSIFIKNETKPTNFHNSDDLTNVSENYELTDVEKIENEILKLKFKLHKLTRNNKIQVNKLNFNKDTKCWWCKNCFDTPAVGIPQIYFEDKFYCFGNFCSYNCALSYNLNEGDNVWKRASLLNLLYYKTYDSSVKIKPAPDWKSLKEFGGNLEIEEFRKNSIVNTSEYTLLHPPLETRLSTFEKIYKTNESKKNDSVYQRLLEDSDELVLKRSKPLKSSQFGLSETGFIKKKIKAKKMNELISSN